MNREVRCRVDDIEIGDEVYNEREWVLVTGKQKMDSFIPNGARLFVLTDTRGQTTWVSPGAYLTIRVDTVG